MQESQSPATYNTAFFGHPKGLMTIFFTEMWERFGYYGMRALLVLYMTKEFLFSDNKAYGIYGAFTAFVYIMPIFGGILADRLLGFRLGSIFGALLMAAGYFVLSVPHEMTAELNQVFFFSALAMIAIGNGLFKPNTSSLVGTLYGKNDSRRDAGYTIFYMGINAGSILAPIACGYVGEVYGWSYGFFLTGVGLLAGLYVFYTGQKYLGEHGLPPNPEKLKQADYFGINNIALLAISILVSIPVVAYLLTGNATGKILQVAGLITFGYILYLCSQSNKTERNHILSTLVMMFFYASFFACFEQAGSSMNLFTDRNVNREIIVNLGFIHWDFVIPTTFFQAVNPIFIVTLAPLVASLWVFLGKRNLEPSTPVKFMLGLLLASAGFYVLVFGTQFADGHGMTTIGWLLFSYFLLTVGELAISPVGLAMISKLSPPKILGLLMGALMLSIAFGNYIAALLATLASAPEEGHHLLSTVESLGIYKEAFSQVSLFALAFALLLLVLTPLVKYLMAEKHEDDTNPSSTNSDSASLFAALEEDELLKQGK